MTLLQHLAELYKRLLRASAGIALGCVVAFLLYDDILRIVQAPFQQVSEADARRGAQIVLAMNGVTEAFTVQLKIVAVSGLIIALPVWLYQLWRFVAPGMTRRERRWAYGFAVLATPLFLGGAVVAYRAAPGLLGLLLGFTPQGVSNIVSFSDYVSFLAQLVLLFGVGMLVPLLLLLLNVAGVVSAGALRRSWRWLLIGCLSFAAIATPTPDPVTMVVVALPFLGITAASVAAASVNDALRGRRLRRAASVEIG